MNPAPEIVKITPVPNNRYLKARVDIAFPSGLIIYRVSVFRNRDGALTIAEPNAPMIGKDGKALTGNDGRTRYWPTIGFKSKAAQERWRKEVLALLNALPPTAIDP